MTAPLRIKRPDSRLRPVSAGKQDDIGHYLERIIKMIPAEVIALYMVGSGVIPETETLGLLIWTVVCLIGVVALRIKYTKDVQENLSADRIHVIISAVAFIIWIYNLGGAFVEYNLHIPYIGKLLVLAWTFFVPIFYKGPKD